MNLRSKGQLQQIPDLDSIRKETRQLRAQRRKERPLITTNYFNIKHINLPFTGYINYYPKYKILTGFQGHLHIVWNLVDDQVYENNHLNEKLAPKQFSNIGHISFIQSTDTIIKESYGSIEMFDYSTLSRKQTFIWMQELYYRFDYAEENAYLEQMIFLNEYKCFLVAKLKCNKAVRTMFNTQIMALTDSQKYIMLFEGFKMKMYFNTKNKTKLVRSFNYKNLGHGSFNGRILSSTSTSHKLQETILIDLSNMKTKAVIKKHNDKFVESLFINQLGLFVILYMKSLDIYDSTSFQMIGREQILDKKLHNNSVSQMAFDGSQLLIFYETKRKFKALN